VTLLLRNIIQKLFTEEETDVQKPVTEEITEKKVFSLKEAMEYVQKNV